MTRTTNARIAGTAFLVYIVAGVSSMVLAARATSGISMAMTLANIAQHTTEMRMNVLLSMFTSLCALTLAITLHGLTRAEDPDLAMLGLVCRVGEGLIGALPMTTLGLLWLATTTGATAPDPVTANALGELLRKVGAWEYGASASLFSAGSLAFCYLFLRGRMLPHALAWLGVIASALLTCCVPLQLAGFISGPITSYVWIPMAAFEIPLGVWLLVTGGPMRPSVSLRT